MIQPSVTVGEVREDGETIYLVSVVKDRTTQIVVLCYYNGEEIPRYDSWNYFTSTIAQERMLCAPEEWV